MKSKDVKRELLMKDVALSNTYRNKEETADIQVYICVKLKMEAEVQAIYRICSRNFRPRVICAP